MFTNFNLKYCMSYDKRLADVCFGLSRKPSGPRHWNMFYLEPKVANSNPNPQQSKIVNLKLIKIVEVMLKQLENIRKTRTQKNPSSFSAVKSFGQEWKCCWKGSSSYFQEMTEPNKTGSKVEDRRSNVERNEIFSLLLMVLKYLNVNN